MTTPAPLDALTVTADELDALARRLGADRFPGVTRSLFDSVPDAHHAALVDGFLAALAARGLLAERDGELVAPPAVAALLAPELRGDTRYEVERIEADTTAVTALGAASTAVVWHHADGLLHRFELVGTDGDVAGALLRVIDPPASAASSRARPFASTRDRLLAARGRPGGPVAGFAVALADGWRATTVVRRLSHARSVPAASWLAVVDGGPGRLWLVEPDPESPHDGLLDGDDPALLLSPVDADDLRRRLGSWCGAEEAATGS
jgi:hypothetical protein